MVCLVSTHSIAGLTWPTNQFLPTFSTPSVLDCIDVSSASGAEQNLFASLEGIVNRTQPRIACVSKGNQEGEFTWLNLHDLAYEMVNGYSAILQYETNVTGLVVTDPSQPDTLNLATTMAGVNNELICDPSLLPTLTNAPYNLTIKDDLRGMFSNKYQVYQYLYANYWAGCTHRIIAGMETNGNGALRDYLVAVKAAVVWLDPGNSSDAAALAPFVSGMNPVGGVYMGWWPSEGNGLEWIGQYGIPVLASDWYDNGSLFSGVTRPISIPPIPQAPPLQNKVYVSFTMSDGDNVQYMQHYMYVLWQNPSRGKVPIGWTVQPLSLDLDPAMLDYYWSTATTNDCLVAGPSGAGYNRINYWSAANIAAYTTASASYLQRSGMRSITVWSSLSTTTANTFATNCPVLVGLGDQGDGYYTANRKGLPTIGFPSNASYVETDAALINGITNTAASWNGSSPMFIAVQADAWDLTPADCEAIANSLNTNKYVVVRPDHLYLLYKQYAGLGVAAASPYIVQQPVAQSANVGSVATLSASATGSLPLSYQWQFNGTNIVNATNSFYSKADVQWSDGGSYSVLVTNAAGRVASSNVILTVINKPFVAALPCTTITPNTATLNGFVVPNGMDTVAWFNWGTNMAYGSQTIATDIGSGYGVSPISTSLTGMNAGVIYHFQLVASNALGITQGSDQMLTTGGRVVAWGDDSYGQTNLPGGLTNVVMIVAGAYHGLALKNDGSVTAWGNNSSGQASVPAGLANTVAVAAGFLHSVALNANGTVSGWGGNGLGQLNTPISLSNVVEIASGAYHNLALKNNGTVVAWGYNNDGQASVPAGLTNVVGVAAGLYHSLALKADGTVVAWGNNLYGQTSVPPGLGNVVGIGAGEFHSLALCENGTVVAWGRDLEGETDTPSAATNVAAADCGGYFNLALNNNGSVTEWGDNSDGELNFPLGLTNVVQMTGGMYFSLAIGNLAPQALSENVSGYVNHDLVIALSGISPDGNPLSYRVTTPPAAGTLYQCMAGGRGAAIHVKNTTVRDSSGRLIFAANTNSVGNPYAGFNYVANDGVNDSALAAVTINMGLPPLPVLTDEQLARKQENGSFELTFQSVSNATYSVWASTNLLNWNWLGVPTEFSPGQYLYQDPLATNWPACFYRLSVP